MATKSPVHLYIYDLSQGMAKMLSPMLLGRTIDAIYHTAIVVHGREYFYGGEGITYCPPKTTMLGEPMEVQKLGYTEIDVETIDLYCADLSQVGGQYHPSNYKLFEHNCNNFSDEFSLFLTEKNIPSKITGLPAEVLQTPFGQQIKQMMEGMDVSPMSQNQQHQHRFGN